ncbi:MAG: ureidoglycolate lyase, partial [Rhodospirillaceae bacterium]
EDPAVGVFHVPILAATAENTAGYGHFVDAVRDDLVEIVPWPQPGRRPLVRGTGIEGGVVTDRFSFHRTGQIQKAHNYAVGREYITGWLADPAVASEAQEPDAPLVVFTHEANYHPDGGQIFMPVAGDAFIALLALPGDDVGLSDFRGFYFDGSRGFHIAPGVWHQPVFPLADKADFITAQGKVHACVSVDFVTEFQSYIALTLRAV